VAGVVGVGGSAYAGSFQTIYSFKGFTDISSPNTLVAIGGTLYGTALYGPGAIFSVTNTGAESVLYTFKGPPDAWAPTSLIAFDGYLFGTSNWGGTGQCGSAPDGQLSACGTVFGYAPSSKTERIVESLGIGTLSRGAFPSSLVDMGGALYGIAIGGTHNAGVAFKIQNGVGSVIYNFRGGADGDGPTILIRIGQMLYGATQQGGIGCPSTSNVTAAGCGTIFKLTPHGKHTVIYAFTGGADGAYPKCLLDGGGALFACVDGSANGSIAELRDGKLRTVYTFQGASDGTYPTNLVHVGDMLYGTTAEGGTGYGGTLFSLTKNGKETILHAFSGSSSDGDGFSPAGLIESSGTLYGVTYRGGTSNNGTVFSYTP
jgi:uncharacterized repeat protein (TIGR03803 family)